MNYIKLKGKFAFNWDLQFSKQIKSGGVDQTQVPCTYK